MDRNFTRKNIKSEPDNSAKAAPSIKVEKLFGGFRQVRLFHGGEEYRLTLTKNDKLILTK